MAIRKFSTASISAGTNKSTKLWDQETFQSGMFTIATAVAGANGDYFDFNNIPQNFTHLQLRVTGAGSYNPGGSGYIETWLGLNNTGTYPTAGYTHRVWGDGSGSATSAATSQTSLLATPWLPYGFADEYVGSYIVDILDYTSTSKFKTIRCQGGYDANGSGLIGFISGYSNITAAVTQIRVAHNAGGFKAGGRCALYGIKAA